MHKGALSDGPDLAACEPAGQPARGGWAERLGQLVTFLPLGLAQISMTAGVLSFAILGPLTDALERFIPLDAGLIDVSNPSEALVLALAGTLSTSAFV